MHILPKLYIIFPVFFILIIEDIHTQNVSTFAEYGTTITYEIGRASCRERV